MLPTRPTANEWERYPWLKEFTFTAPAGTPPEDCGDLMALVGYEPHGPEATHHVPVIVSFWKPSDEELEILNAGGHVEMTIWNNEMNPIALNAVKK